MQLFGTKNVLIKYFYFYFTMFSSEVFILLSICSNLVRRYPEGIRQSYIFFSFWFWLDTCLDGWTFNPSFIACRYICWVPLGVLNKNWRSSLLFKVGLISTRENPYMEGNYCRWEHGTLSLPILFLSYSITWGIIYIKRIRLNI